MKKLFIILSLFISFKALGQTPTSPTPVSQMSWYKDLAGHMWAYRGATLGWIQMVSFNQLGNITFLPKANNGLTISADSTIQLGGQLIHSTNITLNNNDLQIFNSGGDGVAGFVVSPTVSGISNGSTIDGSGTEATTTSNNSRLRVFTTDINSPESIFELNTGKASLFNPADTTYSARYTDGILNLGIIYGADYSTKGKLDDRWIPDWGAVKSIIPVVTGFVPYTGAINNVNLGANNITAANATAQNITATSDVITPELLITAPSKPGFSISANTTYTALRAYDAVSSVNGYQLRMNTDGSLVYENWLTPSGTIGLTVNGKITATGAPTNPNDVVRLQDIGTPGSFASKVDTTGVYIGVKKDFAAKGDARVFTTGSTTASSTTITIPGANFTSADINKVGGIPYGNTDTLGRRVGKTQVFRIVSITDATHAVIDHPVIKTIVAARTVTDGAMTIGSTTLTSATASFTDSDIGKRVVISGVGPASLLITPIPDTTLVHPQECYIINVTNSTTATVSKYALATVTGATVAIDGAWVAFGTDDTQAIQNGINAATTRNKALILENGKYLTTSALIVKSNLDIGGYGAGNSIIYPVGYTFSAFNADNHGAVDSTIYNVKFHDFEIDGSGVRVNLYNTRQKGLYIRPASKFKVYNMYIHNTSATGIGTDFLTDYSIQNNIVKYCGLQLQEPTGGLGAFNAGGGGIGIGTGLHEIEDGVISGNFISNSGNFNIGVEGQNNLIKSKGSIVTDNYSEWGFMTGAYDAGNDGTIIDKNYLFYNKTAILAGTAPFGNISNYAKNGQYTGNRIMNNINGINISSKDMGFTISDNTLLTDSLLAPQEGLKTILVTGGVARDLIINDNKIGGWVSKGISIEADASFPSYRGLYIKNNTVYNTGLTGATRAAIRTNADIPYFDYENNITNDVRPVATRGQSYGFQVTGRTVANLTIGNNMALNNVSGTENLAGTITSTIRRPAYEFAGTWSATQTLSGLNLSALTASMPLILDGSKNVGVGTKTGTGTQFVFAASPQLSGTPLSTTAVAGTNTTQIATTAHVFAERTNTATLTSKTLTSPQINTPLLNTTSVVGQVWTATNTAGAGTWTALPGPASLIVGTPTIVAGAGAGTSPTVSVTSNGRSLQVTVTTGTLPTGTNAVVATVTLANALSYTPYPTFSSANAATSLLNGASMIYMTSSGASNVTITSGTTALVAATTYVWNINL